MHRTLLLGVSAAFFAWSEDSRILYGTAIHRASDRASLVALSVADGRLKVLAYPDAPRGQRYGAGFAVRNGWMYFTLTNDNSDVWVGDLTTR